MSDSPGVIYAVTNPAWPTWYKVGRAEGPENDLRNVLKRRIYSYNTGDPNCAYKAVVSAYAACCRTAERYAHDFLEACSLRRNGEWFQQREIEVRECVIASARIARLHPALRPAHYSRVLAEMRERAEDESVQAFYESLPAGGIPRDTAKAASEVIRDLLELMASTCSNTEADAVEILKRLEGEFT